MKKIAFFTNLALILLILVGDALYIYYGIYTPVNALWIKSVTSALFVILGAANLFFAFKFHILNLKFGILLLCGLTFAMLGDIVLNIHFIGGAILFAIGHIFFFTSYCFLSKINWKDFCYGLAIFVPSLLLITLAPIFDFGSILMEIICIVYALIISLMVGKALSNLITLKNIVAWFILIGSVLFFISDLMLLLNVFAHLPPIVDILCLVTYYPAEIILALSVSASIFKSNPIETQQNNANINQ